MYGSILFNCWGALIGFTVYFLLSIQNIFITPLIILVGSFVTAAITFVVTFFVRMLLHYIFFTPEEVEITVEELKDNSGEVSSVGELPALDQTSSIEFQDGNSEDIAQAVRTMMHSEQRLQTE